MGDSSEGKGGSAFVALSKRSSFPEVDTRVIEVASPIVGLCCVKTASQLLLHINKPGSEFKYLLFF